MKMRRFALSQLMWVVSLQAMCQVVLPKILTDHMVLQRDSPIHIWGQAAPGEALSVTFDTDTASVAADQLGRWSVYLPSRSAGGPYKLTVHATNTVVLNDILMGDIWVASGQSNMEMPVMGWPESGIVVKDSAKEIENANYPMIRLITVNKRASPYPLDDLKRVDGWKLCTPDTVKDFSAVAYFFARDLYNKEKIPIGVVSSNWGGTPVETWVSGQGLSNSSALRSVSQTWAEDMALEESVLKQHALDTQATAQGKTVPRRQMDRVEAWGPSAVYNAMIAPLTKLPIRGVIWYQGESNAGENRSAIYQEVFGALIRDWRRSWQVGDFPFLFVQISAVQGSAELPVVREAQRRTLDLRNTGMAVTIDVGEEKQIHPAQKQAVGHRLALLAESMVFGQPVTSNGPLFREAVPHADGSMQVLFDFARGLKSKDGALGGFEVAGEDRKFAAANASIDGSTVIVRSSSVPRPLYVRYAWKDFPKGANLYNDADLPASPFTSELVYSNP